MAMRTLKPRWPLIRLVAALAWSGAGCVPIAATAATPVNAAPQTRGAYLATIGDCASCHTAGPKAAPYAGGLAINSPFGTIYSSNITPHPEAGIGRYSYADFSRAVRQGIAKDGSFLYPAMPYASFAAMSDEDTQALYGYFMHEVKPVATAPPETALPFPFSQRWALRFWNWAFADRQPYQARTERSVQWNRGAYLVQSLGHCGACHTPRGMAYQERGYSEASPLFLRGAVIDNWFAANLRGDLASGLGRWSEAEIAAFLQTGHGAQAAAFGSMRMVIENSTRYLHPEDVGAIAHYLKSFDAQGDGASYQAEGLTASAPFAATVATVFVERPGAGIYQSYCAKCHKTNGLGDSPKFPKLAGSSIVLSANALSIARLTLEGGEPIQPGHGPKFEKMPSFAHQLTDTEIADVLTFIRNSWGNAAAPVTAREVAVLRGKIKK